MVLLVLALIWAVVLVPQHLRRRAENRPGDSVGAFQRQLSVLGRTGLHPVQIVGAGASAGGDGIGPGRERAVADRRAAARTRRKAIVLGLLAAMAGTFVLGLLPGFGVLHLVHLVVDALFCAYVALLVRSRRISEERRAKVRHLPVSSRPSNTTPPPHQPAMSLRQYGS